MGVNLLSIRQVLERTGLSQRTFYRLRQRGEFARPVKVVDNPRIVLFVASEVDAWRRQRGLERRFHKDP